MVETTSAPARRQPLQAKPKKGAAGNAVATIPIERSASQLAAPPPPPAAVDERPAEPVWEHALRWFGIHALMVVTTWFLGAGFVWIAIAMSQTGRRKRDVLMLLVPVWGAVVMTQTAWRTTSRDVYWSVRDDRPSKPLVDW